jgi:hypothetical protein
MIPSSAHGQERESDREDVASLPLRAFSQHRRAPATDGSAAAGKGRTIGRVALKRHVAPETVATNDTEAADPATLAALRRPMLIATALSLMAGVAAILVR